MESKTSSVRLVIIGCDTVADRLMHATDLFEPFKRLVFEPLEYSIELKPGVKPKDVVDRFVSVKKKSDFALIAVFCAHEPGAWWRDESVKVVSFGTRWCLLEELMKHYGYCP